MDNFRNEILFRLSNEISQDDLEKVSNALDLVLADYNIEPKSRELVITSDDSNLKLLETFLALKLIEGKSKKTIKQYNYLIDKMMFTIGKNVKDITTDDIRKYLAYYKLNNKVNNVTLNNMRVTFNSFFKWCKTEGITNQNPIDRIPKFKIPKTKIKPFTEKELELMFNACDNIRDRALLEFLYSTGMRVTECVDVNIDDIDFENNKVLIRHGKGDKERITYITPKCMIYLQKYLDERNSEDLALWIGRKGRLTKAGVEDIVKKIGKKCDVKAHPHKFRHTLATDMARRGVSPTVIQKVLGHQDISVTMVYLDILDSDVETAYRISGI